MFAGLPSGEVAGVRSLNSVDNSLLMVCNQHEVENNQYTYSCEINASAKSSIAKFKIHPSDEHTDAERDTMYAGLNITGQDEEPARLEALRLYNLVNFELITTPNPTGGNSKQYTTLDKIFLFNCKNMPAFDWVNCYIKVKLP